MGDVVPREVFGSAGGGGFCWRPLGHCPVLSPQAWTAVCVYSVSHQPRAGRGPWRDPPSSYDFSTSSPCLGSKGNLGQFC